MRNPFSWLWNKLFGRGPVFEEKEILFGDKKIKMQMYNKKQLWEALEQAPTGSMMFTSNRTYVLIGHVEPEQLEAYKRSMERKEMLDVIPECDGNCEACEHFKGYDGEGEDGC